MGREKRNPGESGFKVKGRKEIENVSRAPRIWRNFREFFSLFELGETNVNLNFLNSVDKS